MMHEVAFRRAVIAARSASREEPKIVMVIPSPHPKPTPSRPRIYTWRAQHDEHVFAYKAAMVKKREGEWLGVQKSAFEAIRRAVCDQFEISRLEIISHRRMVRISRARQVCMYLAKNFTSYSFPQIALRAGGFDHTTVIHAIKRIAELRALDPELDAAIIAIEAKLQEPSDV